MEEGAKDDEDVPDAVVVAMLTIVDKEIYTAGIGDAFGRNEDKSKWSDALADRLDHEKDSPA